MARLHLSVLASAPGSPALLLDTDPQWSLAWWHRLREADVPNLIEANACELLELLMAALREGIDCVIINRPPHAEDSFIGAMRVADLVLVPTPSGPLDLATVATTPALADRVGKVPLAVSTMPRPGTVQLNRRS